MMNAKTRPNIDQALCNHVMFLMKGGASATYTAQMLGIGKSTVQKIKQVKFCAEDYQKMKQQEKGKMLQAEEGKAETKDPKEWKRWPKPEEWMPREDQLPGQIQMELQTKEPDEQGKAYRFQAAMVDRIVMEMDKINDTLSMLLRAMRKE